MTLPIEPSTGVTDADAGKIAEALKLSGQARTDMLGLAKILYKAFVEKDMSMLEINPLIVMKNGHVRVLDAKVSFDDNALAIKGRHDDILKLRDTTEEDEKEIAAKEWDLAYIPLDGTIGCMVNGAGLAMATMDIIKLYGQEPANFCDVGGGAGKEKVAAAFKIIMKDPNVKGILVNIFGGIMRCDVIAEGVLAAVKETNLSVPLVVRLEGTNAELGKKIIRESVPNVIPANDLDDAAQKIVAAIKNEVSPPPSLNPTPTFQGRQDVHPDRQEHQGPHPGHDRQDRHVPHRAGHRLRHAVCRRHHPGQGRSEMDRHVAER